MATVQELKDALETEQTKAVELADKALTAIDTLLNLFIHLVPRRSGFRCRRHRHFRVYFDRQFREKIRKAGGAGRCR